MGYELNGRQVVDIELDNVVHDPDYWCDAYISGAYWSDNGIELTDAELDELMESLDGDIDELIISHLY